MIMVICGLLIVILFTFILLNFLYKCSAVYYNEFFDINELVRNTGNKGKMIFLGSTYSKYAFGAYKKMLLDMSDFAVQSQCIEMDYRLLKNNVEKCEKGTIVFIVLAACCMMYEEGKDKLIYHLIFKDKKNRMHYVKQNLEVLFPLLFHPRNIKRLLKKNFCYETIYDSFPISVTQEQSEKIMLNMANGWINMFGLRDLKTMKLPTKCDESIKNNTIWLNKIIDL